MRIVDFVEPAAVLFRIDAIRRRHALEELATGLARSYDGLDPARVLALLAERERLGTTAIGNGVAVPNATSPHFERLVGLVGLAPHGIDVAAADRQPARIFVAVLSPTRERLRHLEAIEAVERELGHAPLRERLLAAQDADEVYGVLADADIVNSA